MPYKDKDGLLDFALVPVSEVANSRIAVARTASWLKISGYWVGYHDLFESQPSANQIGRNGPFFLAAACAEMLQPLFSVAAMRDLRGGWVVVRLFEPDSDRVVHYKLEKNRLTSKDLPDSRHRAYWVYMLEKAFAFHRMQFDLGKDGGGKPKEYLAALRGTSFAAALAMLVGKSKAGALMAAQPLRLAAIQKLLDLKLFDDYASRAVELIIDPNRVDQDHFGVCGMASTVHAVLKLRPSRFLDILRSIFNGDDFLGGVGKLKIPIKIRAQDANYAEVLKQLQGVSAPAAKSEPPADVSSLLATRLAQYNRKQQVDPTAKPHAKLDFVVARSLAKMLKLVNPKLYEEQRQFTKQFADPKKPELLGAKKGDLAFTEAGIVFMLTDVIGVPELRFVASAATPAEMVDAVGDWFDKRRGKGPFAIAAINPYCESKDKDCWWFFPDDDEAKVYSLLKEPPVDWARPAWQPFDFAHWIAVSGRIEDRGGKYRIPIWTWAREWKGRLPKAHTTGYLYSIILARLDPE